MFIKIAKLLLLTPTLPPQLRDARLRCRTCGEHFAVSGTWTAADVVDGIRATCARHPPEDCALEPAPAGTTTAPRAVPPVTVRAHERLRRKIER